MLGYNFEIIDKKRKQIVVAYALSRNEEDNDGFHCVISILQTN
jgi:hypothetical protein